MGVDLFRDQLEVEEGVRDDLLLVQDGLGDRAGVVEKAAAPTPESTKRRLETSTVMVVVFCGCERTLRAFAAAMLQEAAVTASNWAMWRRRSAASKGLDMARSLS
jgi:hypothetical protein